MKKSQQTMTLMWAAFCMSQLLFGAVGWVTWPGPDPEAATMVWAVVSLAAPASVMSTVGSRFLVRGEDRAMTRYYIRWAFAESATLFGFVAAFVGGPRWLAPALAGWGFLLTLIAYPSPPRDGP